jgi:enoyl-CoA hydratase
MSSEDLSIRVEGRTGRLTMNRPAALNALTHPMVVAMTAALVAWRDDPAVELVVLDGAGGRGLCAGGDVLSLYDARIDGPGMARAFWRDEYHLNAMISRYPKPFVALQDGIVMGGGIGLSGHAAYRVVTEKSMLAMPETSIGLIPDVGGTWLLARAPGELGTYLALTGARMNAADAIVAGFADVVVGSAGQAGVIAALGVPIDPAGFAQGDIPGQGIINSSLAEADQHGSSHVMNDMLAALESSKSLLTRRIARHLRGRAALTNSTDPAVRQALVAELTSPAVRADVVLFAHKADLGASKLRGSRAEIDAAFGHDRVEDIVAALTASGSDFANRTLRDLGSKSPKALKLTLAALRYARAQTSLEACLNMEYRLVTRLYEDGEFIEGVRALLIDKDKAPKWHPPALAGVTDEMVMRYLAPLPQAEELGLSAANPNA